MSEEDRPASDADGAVELFRRLPDPAAREELVERFLPLARHLARRFAGRGESLDDLIQVADLGLLNAVDRFDPDRGVQFSTFAAVTITGELKRHFRDRGWSIRVPRSLQESALLVHRTLETLWQDLGRSPTITEIARQADLTEEAVIAGDGCHPGLLARFVGRGRLRRRDGDERNRRSRRPVVRDR